VTDRQIFGFCGQTFVTLGLQREKAGRAGLAIYTSVFFAITLELFIFHTLPSFLSLIGVSIILTSAAWVAVSLPTAWYGRKLTRRFKRRLQMLHRGMKRVCLYQELLPLYRPPILDPQGEGNIIHIRPSRVRRMRLTLAQRLVERRRARVDPVFLSRGTEVPVSICIALIAWHMILNVYIVEQAQSLTR
jgi:hypothetical protein